MLLLTQEIGDKMIFVTEGYNSPVVHAYCSWECANKAHNNFSGLEVERLKDRHEDHGVGFFAEHFDGKPCECGDLMDFRIGEYSNYDGDYDI